MMKKIIAMCLLSVMLLGLVSCNFGADDENESGTEDIVTTDTEAPAVELRVDCLADYRIIYCDGPSLNLLKKVRALQGLIEDKYGVEIESSSDSAAVSEREILIGWTNRPESDEGFLLSPRIDDYAVSAVGEKIVVSAHSDEKLIEAIDALMAHMTGISDGELFYETGYKAISLGEYSYDAEEVLLDGVSIYEYTIVYEDSDEGRALAKRLSDGICGKCGYILKASSEPVEGRMILVGRTEVGAPDDMTNAVSSDNYYMGMSGDDLYLYGVDLVSASKAIGDFTELLEEGEGKTVELSPRTGEVSAPDTSLKSMTFNVYWDTSDSTRVQNVIATIRKHSPDTFCVQEATGTWMARLSVAFSDEYAWVGKGRIGNGSINDEYCAVFYKKSRFELIESDTKWLSETPDVAGSVMPGAKYARVFTYALLEDKVTGERFVCMNTHTDHVDDGGAVRLKQAAVITDFIAEKFPDTPLLLTGDMNDTATSSAIKHLLSSGLENSSEIAVLGDKSYSFKQSVIDFLLLSERDFKVYTYDVDTDTIDGEYPSDHRAVVIKYDIVSK
ncbi:MAG: endonuclease/exonuclease/phosphatase family protein [Clostridia bacterium]|nr:endonuclease/exonuclease/phosphatase family protein [Clostridia bacterium]